MARKRPLMNLAQPIKPRTGDMEQLFATEGDVEQSSGLQLVALRIDTIRPDPLQPRQTFVDDSLRELSESIRQDGVIQPIEVTQTGPNQYLLVHGERRWRASQLAGLETIPAVVRRRNYDEVTRFVRQLVENMQREDLNDLDRAMGIIRLRKLMQEEMNTAQDEGVTADEPWGTRVTWAKVGKRLGYSRQRIHQLTNLLELIEEIQEAIREGVLSERDSRVYQKLNPTQQQALFQAHMLGELDYREVREVAQRLKENPEQSVAHTIRILRQPLPEPVWEEEDEADGETAVSLPTTSLHREERPLPPPHPIDDWPETMAPPRGNSPNGVDRLGWVRMHLSKVQRQKLSATERREMLRLLHLIQQDVDSLISVLSQDT
ncbi:MAG: ParB/RepB/Spo0J family partition protein [Anaerolineales bacterium]|nr:ParB/RepB/Spo0J family partition protein [Anaerolineales bacterium]